MLTRMVNGDIDDITWATFNFFFNMDDMVGFSPAHHAILGDFFNHDRQAFTHIQIVLLQTNLVLAFLKPG